MQHSCNEFTVEAQDVTDSGDNYFTLTYNSVTDEESAGGGLENFTAVIPYETYETGTNLPVGDVVKFRIVQATTGGMVVTSVATSNINLGATINDSVPNLVDVSTSDTDFGIQLSYTVPDSGAFPSGALDDSDPQVIVQVRNLDTLDPSFIIDPALVNEGLFDNPYCAPGDSGTASLGFGHWQYEYRLATSVGDSGWSSPATVENYGTVAKPIVSVVASTGAPATYTLTWSGDGNPTDQLVLYTTSGPYFQGYERQTTGCYSIGTLTGSGSESNVTVYSGTYIAAYIISGSSVSALVGLTPVMPFTADNLKAVSVSDSQINLTWNDNASNDDDSLIYRATSNDFTKAKMIGWVEADVNSYQDSDPDLDPTVTYYYWVVVDPATTKASPSTQASATMPTQAVDLWKRNRAHVWSMTEPAIAFAVNDGATLESLAALILNAKYASLLKVSDTDKLSNGTLKRGTRVDIHPLLELFELIARNDVVDETGNFDADFSGDVPAIIGPEKGSTPYLYVNFGIDLIKSYFSDYTEEVPKADCFTAAVVILEKSIMDIVGDSTFVKLYDFRISPRQVNIGDEKIGDWAHIDNYPEYQYLSPRGFWKAENVLCLENDTYWGFPLDNLSYSIWQDKLINQFVQVGGKPNGRVFPGWDAKDVRFIDIARTVTAVFDARNPYNSRY